jgi:hypothetical protein
MVTQRRLYSANRKRKRESRITKEVAEEITEKSTKQFQAHPKFFWMGR